MSNPLSHLFGGGGGNNNSALLPMMMLAAMPHTPPAAPPIQSPVGTPQTYKKDMSQSFVSSAAPVPGVAQTGGKSLLGQ